MLQVSQYHRVLLLVLHEEELKLAAGCFLCFRQNRRPPTMAAMSAIEPTTAPAIIPIGAEEVDDEGCCNRVSVAGVANGTGTGEGEMTAGGGEATTVGVGAVGVYAEGINTVSTTNT